MITMGKEFKMVKRSIYSCLAAFLLLLSACGGEGAGSTVPLSVNKAIVLSANLRPGYTNISSAIKAIEVSFTLPDNVSPVLASDGSIQISETGLKSMNTNGFILSGSYLAKTVHFFLLPNDVATTDLGTGEIARVTYETTFGAELTSQSIQPVFKVSGPGSRPLSHQIEPSVRIEKY